MSLDILYTLVSREQHQWINALCINTLANKQDEVIVGVSVSGTIKLWTVSANEPKGTEIVEHEFKNCLCENAYTLTSCPGKQRIFIVVCPKFFQVCSLFLFICHVYLRKLPRQFFEKGVRCFWLYSPLSGTNKQHTNRWSEWVCGVHQWVFYRY